MALDTSDIEAIKTALQPQFDAIDQRFKAMLNYIDERFDNIGERVNTAEAKVDAVMEHLDGYAKQVETGR